MTLQPNQQEPENTTLDLTVMTIVHLPVMCINLFIFFESMKGFVLLQYLEYYNTNYPPFAMTVMCSV
jgi:hypothetical protein